MLNFFYIYAQIGGTATYQFLNLDKNAHSTALGFDDITTINASTISDNPAILDSSMKYSTTISYMNYFAGINTGNLSFVYGKTKYGNFAFSLHYIDYGKFIAADANGNITGNFFAADYALSLIWSKQIDSVFSVGISLKPIFSVYESYKSIGISSDWGIFYNAHNKLFKAALLISNLGTQIKPYVAGNYEPLPLEMQLNFSQKLLHAPFKFFVSLNNLNKLNLGYKIDTSQNYITIQSLQKQNIAAKIADLTMRHIALGVDFIPSKNFFITFGYNYRRRQELKLISKPGLAGFSTGFAIKLKNFSFFYGFSKYHLAGNFSDFTLVLNMKAIYNHFK